MILFCKIKKNHIGRSCFKSNLQILFSFKAFTLCVRVFFATKLRRAIPAASDRCAWLHGKLSAAFRNLCQIGYSDIFPLATLALRHLCPSSVMYRKNYPGREKPKGFKPKGNKRLSERREKLAYLCRA